MSDTWQFAAWLKQCRQERGLTQDALADQAGCASETVRKMENGRRRPSFQMAARLAEVLQLSSDERTAWMRAAREASEPERTAPQAEPEHAATDVAAPPLYLAPFVGRSAEHADLAALLRQPNCRLVTVLGPGGVGKTRLAAEVARGVESFPDGVAWVSLASLAASSAIVPAIGDALRFTFSSPKDVVGQLLRHLRPRHSLLVLDNMEHLLDPSGAALDLLEQVLTQAPHVRVLVTSRERLNLPGEWVVELVGLDVPPADTGLQCGSYPALALFVEHAQRVQRGFQLSGENERAVATICRLVGGNPLGIELAATWLRVLSVEEISSELMCNLHASCLASSRLPERHRSLSSVVDHSWQLLTDQERNVLARLAVFQGGFSRQAAMVIAGADLAILASLADKSLLRRWATDRYDLHEIIRQFAAERLADDPAAYAATHDRHAAYFGAWLGHQRESIQGHNQSAVLAAIGMEIDNVRAAWHWAAGHGQLEALQPAAETLHWFYEYRNWQAEGAAVFDTAAKELRQLPRAGKDADRERVLGEILGHAGYLAARICGIKHARECLGQSEALLREADNGRLLAHTLVYQVMLEIPGGKYEHAHALLVEARSRVPAGDAWTHALCDTWETQLAYARGNYAQAEQLLWSALAQYRAMENNRGIIAAIAYGSSVLVTLGKLNEAQSLLREGLMLAGTADNRHGMAFGLHQLGTIALAQRNLDEAIYLFREALALFRVIGNCWDVVRVLNYLGAALQAKAATAESADMFREALVAAAGIGLVPDALQALAGLAEHLWLGGYPEKALELSGRILADSAARSETREQALRLREIVRARVAGSKLATAEHRGHSRSLAEVVAELVERVDSWKNGGFCGQPAQLCVAPSYHRAGVAA